MIAKTKADEERNMREILESRSFPGVIGLSDRGIAAEDERIYRTHNIVQTKKIDTGGGGYVIQRPIDPKDQCGCGNCGSHMKRAGVTGVATSKKDVN